MIMNDKRAQDEMEGMMTTEQYLDLSNTATRIFKGENKKKPPITTKPK